MDENRDFTNAEVVWEPREDSGALTKSFMKKIQEKYSVKLSDYWDLYKWSIENAEKFWEEMWHLSGIIYSKTYNQVIDLSVPMSEFHEWFAGSQMNYAENLLRYRDSNVALIVAGEDKATEKVTYAEIYEEVKLYAAALRKQGVKKNDVISCFMSNRKEAIFAMIAATSLGAVWVGALPLMGSQAVLNRLSQVKPKILFTVDRFQHNKEEINMIPKLKEIAKGLTSLEKVIIVPSKPASKLLDISEIRNSCFLDDFLEENGRNCDGSVPEIVFEQMPFTHPVFINYTSGTTGLPKVLYHSSGILLTTYEIFCLQNNNTDRNSCWLSMSPVGWMTWNVFATKIFLGIRVVLFEGLPYFLSPTFFWDMVDDIGITHLMLTANVLDEMEKREIVPTGKNHLKSVKCITSAGSVVKPKNYDFVYGKIKKDVIFTSIYGLTECIGVPVFHDQTLKIHKCEIPAPALGFDYQSVDDSGKPVTGEVGEIVLVKPFPSLILGLFGDTDRSLFRKSYCEKYPGKFTFGDLVVTNPVTKGIIILGRSSPEHFSCLSDTPLANEMKQNMANSYKPVEEKLLNFHSSPLFPLGNKPSGTHYDSDYSDETLKPGGCRFGSSEIYNIVDNFPEILDSICVSQYSKEKLERAVLFLKMRSGCFFDRNLIERLKEAITKELSASHVPEVILETADIPRNINGKKLEITVKKIINKLPYNPETAVNSVCLKNFVDLPELSGF